MVVNLFLCYNKFGDKMKKGYRVLICLLCSFLLVGCNEKKEEKMEANLSNSIVIDETGAKAVCKIDYDYSDSEGYVIGAKFVIFADENDIVTRVVGEQIAATNNKAKLANIQSKMETTHQDASKYGGYQYDIKISGKQLIIDTDIDYTKLNLEEMAKNNEELKVYLTEDYKYKLSDIQAVYMMTGAECTTK